MSCHFFLLVCWLYPTCLRFSRSGGRNHLNVLWSLTIEETRVYMYILIRCGLSVYVCLYYKYI
nr:MAG TPA: hypothetical protein [Caudoviricetes sp.]